MLEARTHAIAGAQVIIMQLSLEWENGAAEGVRSLTNADMSMVPETIPGLYGLGVTCGSTHDPLLGLTRLI